MARLGRPPVMTEEIIAKLEEGFLYGLTDLEACLYADIHPASLYRYCQDNPDFSERKEILKDQIKMRAKMNIAEGITQNDRPLSQWYLETKGKNDGFSKRSEVTGKDGEAIKAKLDLSSIPTDELERIASQSGTSETGTSSA